MTTTETFNYGPTEAGALASEKYYQCCNCSHKLGPADTVVWSEDDGTDVIHYPECPESPKLTIMPVPKYGPMPAGTLATKKGYVCCKCHMPLGSDDMVTYNSKSATDVVHVKCPQPKQAAAKEAPKEAPEDDELSSYHHGPEKASSYAGTKCLRCGRVIQRGEMIKYNDSDHVVHVSCGSSLAPRKQVEPGTELVGLGASRGSYEGVVRVISSPAYLSHLQQGEVLACRATDPNWIAAFDKAGAILTAYGSRLCHAAIVAREYKIPCVVGMMSDWGPLATGQRVRVEVPPGKVVILSVSTTPQVQDEEPHDSVDEDEGEYEPDSEDDE